jgi:hypothetical protein
MMIVKSYSYLIEGRSNSSVVLVRKKTAIFVDVVDGNRTWNYGIQEPEHKRRRGAMTPINDRTKKLHAGRCGDVTMLSSSHERRRDCSKQPYLEEEAIYEGPIMAST